MATTTDKTVLFSGQRRSVHHLTGLNTNATGETGVTKVDKSTLKGPDGGEPSSLTVEAIEYSVQGFSSVELLWDHGTDINIAYLSGAGEWNWYSAGGKHDTGTGTGDILLTSRGAADGDTYDITLWLKHEQ
jgi:hypothetical protein